MYTNDFVVRHDHEYHRKQIDSFARLRLPMYWICRRRTWEYL